MEWNQLVEAIQAPLQILGQTVQIYQGLVGAIGQIYPSSIEMEQFFLHMAEQCLESRYCKYHGMQLTQDPMPLVYINILFIVGDGLEKIPELCLSVGGRK